MYIHILYLLNDMTNIVIDQLSIRELCISQIAERDIGKIT